MSVQMSPKNEAFEGFNKTNLIKGAGFIGAISVIASQVSSATASVMAQASDELAPGATFTASCMGQALTIPITNTTFTNIFQPFVVASDGVYGSYGCDLINQFAAHGPDLSTFTFQVSTAAISYGVPVITSLALTALHLLT